jgi:hypothetical protein
VDEDPELALGAPFGALLPSPAPGPSPVVTSCIASATASQIRRQVLNLWRGDQSRSISGLALRVASGLV